MNRRFLFLVTGALLATSTQAAVIDVPGDQPTIRAGIDAAVNGDTVLVAPGTYFENIDFLGKAITVKSSNGASVTIIDGQQLSSVVRFRNGEGLGSVLSGFTITNGSGTPVESENRYGGGILCYDHSSATIEYNTVSNNTACGGGGISCLRYCSPVIRGNTIANNTALQDGGGSYRQGGGISCMYSSSPQIIGNLLIDNTAGSNGGGINCRYDCGPTIASNEIRGNRSRWANGGGINLNQCGTTTDIRNNLIIANTSGNGSEDHAGGIHVYQSVATLADNLIALNVTTGYGGGLSCADASVITLSQNTFAGNSAAYGGAVRVWTTATVTVRNSILWGNTAYTSPSIYDEGGMLTVTYSDIEGGWTGTGNINTDPLFLNPSAENYRLRQDPCEPGITNPCVNTGDPGSSPVAGSTRSDRIVDVSRVDMGYHDPTWYPEPQPSAFLGQQEKRSGSSADPVNTATGNFMHEEVDLRIATRSHPLVFARFYNSVDSSSGPLGSGWTHSYRIWLDEAAPDGQVAVHWADGRVDYWVDDGGGGYRPSVATLFDSLVDNGNNTWTVTTKDLDRYDFDSSGRLTAITDKSGNVTTLTYEDANWPDQVTGVSDPAGRSLALSYNAFSGLLESVSDFGTPARTVSYSYTSGDLTQVTDVLGNPIDYTYDSNGYLETITDQRGVTVVSNAYDAEGRVTEQTDGRGNTTEFLYDTPATNQTTIRRTVTVQGTPRTLETVHAHSETFHLLGSIENPLGDALTIGYDAAGNRTSVTDRNGHTTTYAYDERGNVLTVTDPDDPADPNDGGVTTIEHTDARFPDLPTKQTDALGYVIEWTYESHGNVETETRWLDLGQTEAVTRSWTYNGFGQRRTEVDGRGHTWEWTYDGDGRPTAAIDPEGDQTWYGHDALWRLTSQTDGRGSGAGDPAYTTHFEYDAADRLTETTSPPVGSPPHAITVSYEYDEIGNRTRSTDGNGNIRNFSYDNESNLTRVEEPFDGNPAGRVTQYGYDELNRRTSMVDALGNTTSFEYDDADRLERREDGAGNQWTTSYDDHGNVLSETDPSGVTLTHEYDTLNRRTRTTDELSHEWLMAYDRLGQRTSATDPNGNETRFTYDGLGRLESVEDAAGGITRYGYDAAGNLTEIEDVDGKVVSQREYWDDNRLKKATDGLGYYYDYAYDAAGNQTGVTDAKHLTTTLTPDAVNRIVHIAYPDSTEVAYTYDDNGNRTGMTDPVGSGTFGYDEMDWMVWSQDPFGQQVQYGYDALGNRTSVTYPDSRQVTCSYDAARRLTAVTDFAARVTAYTYDGMRVATLTYPSGVVETRGYDAAGRLSSLVTEDSALSPLLSLSWSRDGVGNPTSATETGTLQPDFDWTSEVDYRYDADNRLESSREIGGEEPYRGATGQPRVMTSSYEHDANGNLIRRHVKGITTTFTYDSEDRLVSQSTLGRTVQHVYDGLGNRLARIEGGMSTRYVLDQSEASSEVLCETDGVGAIQAYYIYGLELVGRIGSDGSQRSYHLNDIGSVVALTDENELITDRYGYTPFGVLAAQEGETENPFTYVGGLGVMAEADGLYFMRARFKDPETGRFLGKDPIEGDLANPQELHRYAYALNNPIVMVDPDGERTRTDAGGPDDRKRVALDLRAATQRQWRRAVYLAEKQMEERWGDERTQAYKARRRELAEQLIQEKGLAPPPKKLAPPQSEGSDGGSGATPNSGGGSGDGVTRETADTPTGSGGPTPGKAKYCWATSAAAQRYVPVIAKASVARLLRKSK
ncbi:MAG: DUF6531 domain-containing protein [Planctomycetota bacterium]